MMKKAFTGILLILICGSFKGLSLKGMWQYCGGTVNGKASPAPTEYTLQRKYAKNNYEAFVLEPGQQPFKYEEGNYSIKKDTCFETQTFCSQPSQTLNKTITYTCKISNDTLILSGVLPNGATVQDYWKKLK